MLKCLTKTMCLAGTILLASSCANYKINQAADVKDWTSKQEESDSPLSHSIYLIGDVGMGSDEDANATLALLKKELDQAPKNSSVLFLGNNASPYGMPSKSKEEARQKTERRLDAQLAILKNFEGRPIFLPGERDWGRYGLKGLSRQEEHIESALNNKIEEEDNWKDYFMPSDGCPGPEVIEINKNLVVIVFDSQWWLMDWKEEPNVNEGCDVKSRAEFELLMEATIKDHKNKNIVFASHHSFKSMGPRGGRFTAGNHLFPLTTVAKKVYVPLPGVGSLFLLLRSAGVFPQDQSNRHYQGLKDATVKVAETKGEYIFVSGHEHSLQYLKDDGQHFVIAGSGAKKTATAKGGKALFSYGQQGFSKIDFYKDGSSWLTFYAANDAGTESKVVFRYKMKGPLSLPTADDIPKSFPEYESGKDSVYIFPTTLSVKPQGKFANFMLGKRRRELYLEKYNFPTLDLSTFKGGIKVLKKGGGNQTNSLRLEGADGKEYVMRSLTKDVSRGVPYPFNQLPIVTYLFSETFLGVHPFAPLTIAPLADAAKVYHTNPGIYYVPKQPALGVYNDFFGGEVYIVEERPSKEWPDAPFFGNATKFTSTPKLRQKTEKNDKHRPDQTWLVRSRLFDMLIGDFDRHGDQWRWTVKKEDDGTKTYQPIPRDRDNAYSIFDGFAFKLLKPYHSLVRQLATYDDEVGDPKWTYYNARQFDHNFLNQLSLEEWKREAAYIQENVTDEIIESAVRLFPDKVYAMTGADITQVLKNRRDNLQNTAESFYKQLARKSMIHGTNKKEYFEIIRLDDEHTEVNMYDSNKEEEKNERLFHRIFKTSETEELYIYGLEDDDVFHISGSVNDGIKIFVVGGHGNDKFIDKSRVAGLKKKDRFYDSKKGNILELGTEGKDKTSNIVRHNTFEQLGPQFDESPLIPVPVMGYNAGDGFNIGFKGIYHSHRFNKSPFGQDHQFAVNYSFLTQGVDALYSVVFYETTSHWDFVVNAEARSNRYSYNFFGIGNETEQLVDGIEYYRVQQSMLYLDLGWQRRFAREIGKFSVRPSLMNSNIRDTENLFIDQPDNGLPPEDFIARWYAGGVAELNFANTDNDIYPRDGFRFQNRLSMQSSFDDSERKFTKFASSFTLYKSFLSRRNLIIASRVGTELIRGEYDFVFAPALGQDENLRGYFGQRFRGENSLFHTSDLRLGLGSFSNSILPFSFGITGSFDYGRIFQPGEDSKVWHSSAGGGIWFAPLNVAVITFSYNKPLDEDLGQFRVVVGGAF